MKLKNDKYRRARGGRSKILSLSCAKCSTLLFDYQKDGPGILKRLYIDRIINALPKGKSLTCKHCKELLGIRVIYKKENRPAVRLFTGAIAK